MITFKAEEILKIAEKIERDGAAFYGKAAQLAGRNRPALEALAEAEQEHEKTFAGMRRQLPAAATVFDDASGEAQLYLAAVAEGKVFDLTAGPADQISGREPLTDILHKAIGLEKDSIVFYLTMREMVPGQTGRDSIEAIIREELGHVVSLTKQLDELVEATARGQGESADG